MENVGFEERRAFHRFPVKIILKYRDLNSMQESYAQTHDISAKGLCFLTNTALDANTPLDIWLQMPDNDAQIYIKGKIVWSNMIEPDKYRVGVQLEDAELNPISLALKAIQVRINH